MKMKLKEKKPRSKKKLNDRPKYKILKSQSNSLKMTVKRAVQEQLDKSVSKLLNENISLTNETITLEEDDVESSDLEKSVKTFRNDARAKQSKNTHTVENEKVIITKIESKQSTTVNGEENDHERGAQARAQGEQDPQDPSVQDRGAEVVTLRDPTRDPQNPLN